MYRISTGLAACLAAAAIAGCATAPAAGTPDHTTSAPAASVGTPGQTQGAPATSVGTPGQTQSAPALSVGTPAGCLRTLTITLAGNGKTYCFRVGQKLDVFLRGTLASMWQEPQVSGNVLRGVPNGAFSLVAGLTGASYAAVRPGRAVLTSVRPPCSGGGTCAQDHRFRVVIIVLRLRAGPVGVGLRAGPGLVSGVADQGRPTGSPVPLTGPPARRGAERTVVDMDNRNTAEPGTPSRDALNPPRQPGRHH